MKIQSVAVFMKASPFVGKKTKLRFAGQLSSSKTILFIRLAASDGSLTVD
jgi:hypothetical protein